MHYFERDVPRIVASHRVLHCTCPCIKLLLLLSLSLQRLPLGCGMLSLVLISSSTHPTSRPPGKGTRFISIISPVAFIFPCLPPKPRRLAMTGSAAPSKWNHEKVTKTCVECRRRKIRCDGRNPCDKCIYYMIPNCEYSPRKRRQLSSQR